MLGLFNCKLHRLNLDKRNFRFRINHNHSLGTAGCNHCRKWLFEPRVCNYALSIEIMTWSLNRLKNNRQKLLLGQLYLKPWSGPSTINMHFWVALNTAIFILFPRLPLLYNNHADCTVQYIYRYCTIVIEFHSIYAQGLNQIAFSYTKVSMTSRRMILILEVP